MKTSIPQIRWLTGLISTAVLPALVLFPSAVTAAISVVAASDSPPNQSASVQVQFSAGISEILKMADAKVEGSVIIAYIDSSPTAYNPSASEIIMLKDRGVPSEVIAAMLKHGGDVRARAMTSTPPPSQPAPDATAPYTQNPDYTYAPPANYSDYGYPSSSVYYYNYGYPYYSYGYPWYGYWPSSYFSYYPYYRNYYRYPYYHRYPYNSFGHFGYHNHFTAYRSPTHFSGGFSTHGGGGFSTHGGGGFSTHGGRGR
jgi:hypothetical protein